jgi:hypothetical protein
MRVFIGLVTGDEALRRHFGSGKDAIVPKDAVNRGYFRDREPVIAVAAWKPEFAPSQADFERYLLGRTRNADACVLLVDSGWTEIVANARTPAFTIVFDPAEVAGNAKNFFHKILAKGFRTFGQLLAKFDRGDDAQLLVLPLRNFAAPELAELARLCKEEYISPTFDEDVERELASLRRRVRPRRRTSYKTIYAVDDLARFFSYGKERHARFATGAPHKPYCELAGIFRFGRRVDDLRHFNVSETEGDQTKIEGDFRDCHAVVHPVKARTHLNMFCNDYF